MSLHGELKVNGRVIAEWSARRVNGGIDPDDINTYDWWYLEHPQKITYERHPECGSVVHRYGDGAAALAAKVLSYARSAQKAREKV